MGDLLQTVEWTVGCPIHELARETSMRGIAIDTESVTIETDIGIAILPIIEEDILLHLLLVLLLLDDQLLHVDESQNLVTPTIIQPRRLGVPRHQQLQEIIVRRGEAGVLLLGRTTDGPTHL